MSKAPPLARLYSLQAAKSWNSSGEIFIGFSAACRLTWLHSLSGL